MSVGLKDYPFSIETPLAQMVLAVQTQDQNRLIQFINSILSEGELRLPHPKQPTVETFCYSSIEVRFANVLCFADAAGENRWYWIQTCSFIDGLVLDGNCYQLHGNDFGDAAVENVAYDISHRLKVEAWFESIKPLGGVLVSHSRPAHYFYDQLVNLPHLDIPKSQSVLTTERCFFDPIRLGFNARKMRADEWALRPQTTPANYQFARDMEQAIKSWASSNKVTQEMSPKVLWIGIADEKRCWKQQVEGYAALVNRLAKSEDVVLYVDGFTAYDGDRISLDSENQLFQKLSARLDANVQAISLIGLDYPKKLSYGVNADYFVTYIGTQSIVPLRLLGLPGVLHSNGVYGASEKFEEFPLVSRVPVREVSNEVATISLKGDYLSYHMAWESIYNRLASLDIDSGIEMITVPPLARLIESSGPPEAVDPFQLLGEHVANFKQSADILREVALCFERSEDLDTALTLMSKALALRPSGVVLQRKVESYRRRLAKRQSEGKK